MFGLHTCCHTKYNELQAKAPVQRIQETSCQEHVGIEQTLKTWTLHTDKTAVGGRRKDHQHGSSLRPSTYIGWHTPSRHDSNKVKIACTCQSGE